MFVLFLYGLLRMSLELTESIVARLYHTCNVDVLSKKMCKS